MTVQAMPAPLKGGENVVLQMATGFGEECIAAKPSVRLGVVLTLGVEAAGDET
jgi:hypothetical protein